MNKILNAVTALLLIVIMGCLDAPNNAEQSGEKVAVESTEDVSKPEVIWNIDSISAVIDKKRRAIETNLPEPLVVMTQDLRAKIKQKWQTIHFYAQNGDVVKIKTYPHPNISGRTEEFYLDDGQLILAAIEDNGAGEKGKLKEEIDKMYYYYQDKPILEEGTDLEKEYTIEDADAYELLQEVKEYLDIYRNQLNQ